MAELFTQLGVDWKLLLAQMVNFAVLFWILRRYAYRPILNALERRRQTIAKSLDDAEQIATERKLTEQQREEILHQTRAEAQSMLERAQTEAARLVERAQTEAAKETAVIRDRAKRDAAREKEQVVADLQGHLADLVSASTEKVIGVKLSAAADQRLIADAIRRSTEEVG